MIRRFGVRLQVLFAGLGAGAAVFALVEIRHELARQRRE
jgi:hypothetical protein